VQITASGYRRQGCQQQNNAQVCIRVHEPPRFPHGIPNRDPDPAFSRRSEDRRGRRGALEKIEVRQVVEILKPVDVARLAGR